MKTSFVPMFLGVATQDKKQLAKVKHTRGPGNEANEEHDLPIDYHSFTMAHSP